MAPRPLPQEALRQLVCVVSAAGRTAEPVGLPHVHVAISNFKTWLRGTYRGVSDHQMQVHLDEFVFRFNRRRTPMAAFQTLLGISSRIAPTTYAEVKDSGPIFRS